MTEKPILSARPDGLVASDRDVLVPLMAPRLQGEFHPEGRLKLSVWGCGDLGTLDFTKLTGPYLYTPNGVIAASGGLYVAQSQPALAIKGAHSTRLTPARHASPWDSTSHSAHPKATAHGRTLDLPWGSVIVETRGHDLVVAVGSSHAEAVKAAALTVEEIVAEAQAYTARCDQLPEADPVLRSMIIQGVHASLSARRYDRHGHFAGLAAGLAYSAPARTYYRDGYWTLQALLTLDPETVRAQIDILAHGVHDDGECPSGVIVGGARQARAWDKHIHHDPDLTRAHRRFNEWWSDHFDSPLFFLIMLGEYVATTGDEGEADRHWPLLPIIFDRYLAWCEGGLPLKPRHDRDWADNVYREGYVAYDLGLWVGALDALAALAERRDVDLWKRARMAADAARAGIDQALWRDGWYADYATLDGFVEGHLALDSLTLLRHDAVPDDRALETLENVRKLLETRNNPAQPYGDWGMMCAWPKYSRRVDLRSKTAFPYRYHNGSDWPYLSGLYAGERLRRGLPGWRYPMVRWWEVCLAKGWLGALEYHAPPWGRGSLLQGWSSLPAAVALEYRDEVLAGDPETYSETASVKYSRSNRR